MNRLAFLALVLLLLSGCVNQMVAHEGYGDVAAAAAAYKQECAQGDKEQCAKFAHAQDRCREMIALGDGSPTGLVCQRMVNEGIMSTQ
jgi:hypothetical protein